MEKVVVVVVVTMREGSFGSGMRFDWENLSEPKLLIASSEVNVWSYRVNRTRCESNFKLTINVENKSIKSCVHQLNCSQIRILLAIPVNDLPW